MSYSEFRPPTQLSSLVACTWERAVPSAGGPAATRVLPDGCVDLVWGGGQLFVAGPDRGPFMSPLELGETIVGLRLRPGVAGHALGVPASELRDIRVPLGDVWGRPGIELGERIAAAGVPARRRRVLEAAIATRRSRIDPLDPLVLTATRRLGLPGSRVGALSATLATSERQLLRRFEVAVGYGPKTLDRILRFQRFLTFAPALASGAEMLARLAADLGYADQSHLSRECVRLSGLTPVRLAARWGA